MEIVAVNTSNQYIYMNLAQAYEAEFSKIMAKQPGADGLFSLDTALGGDVQGYLLYCDDVPAGLTAIACTDGNNYEVCDFYVVPYFRQNQLGKRFITAVFAMLGGRWQIKQVAGADHAVHFWNHSIDAYTQGRYQQDSYEDVKWGKVTRQCFDHAELQQDSRR